MKKTLIYFLLISMLYVRCQSNKDIEEEASRLELRWLTAIKSRDVEAMRSILADKFVGIYSDGYKETKEGLLKRWKDKPFSASFSITDTYVRDRRTTIYKDSVVVEGIVVTIEKIKNKIIKEEERYIDTYQKILGTWQVIMTRLYEIEKSSDIVKIKVGNSPGSIEVADFNHDNFPDLAVTGETDSSVTILLGDGEGGFTSADNSPFFAGSVPNDICIADFNKDGNPDLAFANHEKKYLTVLLGDGKGNFKQGRNSPCTTEGIPHVHGVATGDFNNDGWLDLVTDSWGNDQVEVLFGDNSTSFSMQRKFFKVGKRPYQRLRAADLNGDGIADIVTTNTEGNNVTVLLADGKGGFNEAAGSPFACGDNPFNMAIGDVNADGKPDLAIINSPSSMAEGKGKNGMTVLLGNGMGKFTTMKGSPFEAGKIPNRIAIGDVNGDGINDIVTSDNDSNKIYLFLFNENGHVSLSKSITVGNHPKGVAIADLNGDGKGDIVVCNQLDNDITIIINK